MSSLNAFNATLVSKLLDPFGGSNSIPIGAIRMCAERPSSFGRRRFDERYIGR